MAKSLVQRANALKSAAAKIDDEIAAAFDKNGNRIKPVATSAKVSKSAVKAVLGKSIGSIFQIDPRAIDVLPKFNVRPFDPANREHDAELLHDIVTNGYDMTQPVMVARGADGRFKIVRGHRRFGAVMAAIASGVEIRHIAATLEDAALAGDEAAHQYDLIRSNEGEPLRPEEAGLALRRLMDVLKIPAKEVAANIGKSEKWVYACVKASKQDATLRKLVADGLISGTLVQRFVEAHGQETTKKIVKTALATGGVKTGGKQAGKMTAKTAAAAEKTVTGKTTVADRETSKGKTPAVTMLPPVKGRQDTTTNGALLSMTRIDGPFSVGGPDDCEIWDKDKSAVGYGNSPVLTRAIVDGLNIAHFSGDMYKPVKGAAPIADAPGGNVTPLRAAAAKMTAPARKGKRRHA